MRVKNLPKRFILITFCLAFISLTFSFQITHSQTNKPLTLAQVLTGLQSKSGGFTLSQKNTFITDKVRANGVTFTLTPQLEKELRTAGASASLIRVIRLKSPRTNPTPKPDFIPESGKPNATYRKIVVEQNAIQDGISGIRIISNFSVYNMKDIKSDIVYRFKKNNVYLKGKTTAYKTKAGHLSGRRYLTPAHTAAVFENLIAFIPYSEFGLAPGVHDLTMETAVILRDGKMVKRFPNQLVKLVVPGAKPTGSATFGKMWVDYKVKENGVWGMRVHVKMTVRGMKAQPAYLQILFSKQDGTPLNGRTSKYRSPSSGQTAAYRLIRPIYNSSNFNDVNVFIPYSEFNLPVGKYTLQMHADLVSTSYQQISHLNYKTFTYTRSK